MDKAKRLQELIKSTATIPTVDRCQKMLDELDRPGLSEYKRNILQSLVNEDGCVVLVKDEWRWLWINDDDSMGCMTFDKDVKEMIASELVGCDYPRKDSGMTCCLFIKQAGRDALNK